MAGSTLPLGAADSSLRELVRRFTEKQASQPAAVPAAQPVAPAPAPMAPATEQSFAPLVTVPGVSPTRIDGAAAKPGKRKPSPLLSSLPPLKAAGSRRILLVDDDWDSNASGGSGQLSGSDKIFRALIAAAVGGDAAAWSLEMVPTYKDGPAFERLRDFNVIVWYTGSSYGGGYDGRSTLSVEDEKIVRRYLQEVGGAFILVSPGFLTTRTYATTWTESDNPFLKEVMGVNGLASLAQRFQAGTVRSANGNSFTVEAKGVIETQFSAVNPDGAAVVFNSTLDPKRTMDGPVPVSVAHPFGGGRFVYVGFSFENIVETERAKAFDFLLEAAGAATAPVAQSALPTRVVPTAVPDRVGQQRIVEAPPAPVGPPVANLEITRSYPGMHYLRWIATLDTGIDQFEVYRRDAAGWKFLRGGFRENFFNDPSYVAPGSAYKVVAVYRDGRRGEAVVEYPNPPQPQAPTGLRVVQTGPETVQIDWVNVPGVGKYRIYGPGAPDAGMVVTTGTLTEPGYGGRTTMPYMPIGIHEIRVAAEYAPGPAPVYASAHVAVNSDRGRYRVVFLGLKVNTAVNDDMIDADGRGNEIYAAAFWATAPLTSGAATQGGFARTLVQGDTTNFPNRIRAGSAGPTGGLRAGDVIPSLTASVVQPGLVPQSDRFPLKLWEGELIEGGPIVGLVPIVFEWNAGNHENWDIWANFWSRGGNILDKLAEAMRKNLSAPLAAQPLHGFVTMEDYTVSATEQKEQRPHVPSVYIAADRDRPIGVIHVAPPRAFVQPDYGHSTLGFALTRARVEAALAGRPHTVLQINWSDAVSGNYTGYFQIDRLSEPPLVAPPPPTIAPVVAAGTLVVPGLIGTAVSGQPATPPATPSTPSITRPLPGGEEVTGRTIQPPAAPPPGPPPADVTFSSEHPARHTIRWRTGTGATFDVYRKTGDQLVLVTDGTTFAQTVDESFVAPGTVYRIAARYPDGRYGYTDVTFANPAQPAVVTELKMTQTGERKAKLTWKWSSGSFTGFRVFAPGLPPEGQAVTLDQHSGTMSYDVANVPEGPQLFRVAYQYGNKTAPVDARITATVASWSGQYRAVLLGFRVGRKTVDDDIFDGDGRGDEVFFAAYRALVSNTVAPLGTVRSAVFGDINRFPTRIRAGNAGPTGGVRSGDVIPSEAALAPQPGIFATPDRLPFLLWEGSLRNDGAILAIGFSGLEWDNDSVTPLNDWINWWNVPNGSSGIQYGAREAIRIAPDEIRYVPFAMDYEIQPEKPMGSDRLALPPPPGTPREKRYVANLYYGAPLATRPIGIIKSVDPRQWYYVAHGFALTRRNVEATLKGGNVAVISASLATRRGPGLDKPEEQDEAQYTVYVQVERTSPPPITAD